MTPGDVSNKETRRRPTNEVEDDMKGGDHLVEPAHFAGSCRRG